MRRSWPSAAKRTSCIWGGLKLAAGSLLWRTSWRLARSGNAGCSGVRMRFGRTGRIDLIISVANGAAWLAPGTCARLL